MKIASRRRRERFSTLAGHASVKLTRRKEERSVAEYVDLRGVRTWYDVHGAGEPLLLVHPGGVGVDSRAFGPNIRQLSEAFRVYTPDRRGHGRTPDVGPITYEAMAADTIEFIERVIGAPTRVLGMSDGAITALYVAMERPDLVTRLAFVAGVFHRDGWHHSALEGDPTREYQSDQPSR
jgi:pimeloyl-ACP methyl ester carboxylesterase